MRLADAAVTRHFWQVVSLRDVGGPWLLLEVALEARMGLEEALMVVFPVVVAAVERLLLLAGHVLLGHQVHEVPLDVTARGTVDELQHVGHHVADVAGNVLTVPTLSQHVDDVLQLGRGAGVLLDELIHLSFRTLWIVGDGASDHEHHRHPLAVGLADPGHVHATRAVGIPFHVLNGELEHAVAARDIRPLAVEQDTDGIGVVPVAARSLPPEQLSALQLPQEVLVVLLLRPTRPEVVVHVEVAAHLAADAGPRVASRVLTLLMQTIQQIGQR